MLRRLAVLREQNAAVRIVQMHWRCRQSRLREEQHDLLMESIEAALCVQALWRGRKERRRIESDHTSREEAMEQLEAAVCIQVAWREQCRQRKMLPEDSRSDASGLVGNGISAELEPGQREDLEITIAEESILGTGRAHYKQESSGESEGENTDTDTLMLGGDQTLGDECARVGSDDADEGDEKGDSDSESKPSGLQTGRRLSGATALTIQPGESEVQEQARRSIDADELESQLGMKEVHEALQCAVDQVCGIDPAEARTHERHIDTEKSLSASSLIEPSGEYEHCNRGQIGERDSNSPVNTGSDHPHVDERGPKEENKEPAVVMREQERAPDELALLPVLSIIREVNEALRCAVNEVCDVGLVNDRQLWKISTVEMISSEPSQIESTGELDATDASCDEADQAPLDTWSHREESATDDPRYTTHHAAVADPNWEDSEVSDGIHQAPHSERKPCSQAIDAHVGANYDDLARQVMDGMLQNLETGESPDKVSEVKDSSCRVASTPRTESSPAVSIEAGRSQPAKLLVMEAAEPTAVDEAPAPGLNIPRGVDSHDTEYPVDTLQTLPDQYEYTVRAVPMTPFEELTHVQRHIDEIVHGLTHDIDMTAGKRERPPPVEPIADSQSQEPTTQQSHEPSKDFNTGMLPDAITISTTGQILIFQETSVEGSATKAESNEDETRILQKPAVPEAIVSDEEQELASEDESEEEERSQSTSVDSNDLMWEADALLSFKGASIGGDGSGKAPRKQKKQHVRMDSERILADLSLFGGET